MNARERPRLIAGVVLVAMAAVVGLISYLKLSVERDLNRQIPYLASGGMAVLVLAAVGAALLLADQLRADNTRVQELERAVTLLAGALAGSIEAPPRRAEPTSKAPAKAVGGKRKAPARKVTAKKTPGRARSSR